MWLPLILSKRIILVNISNSLAFISVINNSCNFYLDNIIVSDTMIIFWFKKNGRHDSLMAQSLEFDVLIIGSGLAGLSLALHLPSSLTIAVLCKNTLTTGASWAAQGGIAAVMSDADTVQAHTNDTLNAGSGLCHEKIVRFTVGHGPANIQWLLEQGVPFTKDAHQKLHLTQEGGHSQRRIAHVADATGYAVTSTLLRQVQSASNITVLKDQTAVDLVTTKKFAPNDKNRCVGAYALDVKAGKVQLFRSKVTVLATGGASRVYLYSSSRYGASGDGIAMGWRAGCRVGNMEFNQFHPTCLYHAKAQSFLISEAVRGEGGRLVNLQGHAFMDQYDVRAELAPRDIVARAIDHEMKRLGCRHVYLDISHKTTDFIVSHFPTIYEKCMQYGIDMTREPIPVVPAAHYTCGGIVVDEYGRTDVLGLYAIGETSFTGLHGANRLASNSLLECLVYAKSAASHICSRIKNIPAIPSTPDWDSSQVSDSDENVVISHNWAELRRFMWDYVGIVRTTKRLLRAMHRIDMLQHEIQEFYNHFKISHDLIELRNLAQVAELIVKSALQRRESRGLHYTMDYPETLPFASDTILFPAP